MSDITVIKRDHNGGFLWQYEGERIDGGATWVCLRARFNRNDSDAGYVVFRRGDVFTEWFYADRWYNIFEMHDVDDGHLKGWYCNVTRPALITETTVEADDLALDMFVSPNGAILVLDEDEFAALDLTDQDRQQALAALDAIRQLVETRQAPFEGINKA